MRRLKQFAWKLNQNKKILKQKEYGPWIFSLRKKALYLEGQFFILKKQREMLL